MSRAADPNRRVQIAKIKMAQKHLGLDEETYRALLVRVTGCQSSAAMTSLQRDQVLAEMARQGWTGNAASAWQGRPKNTDKVPMLRKVEALLANAKRPWEYAHATANRMFGVDRLEFLSDEQLRRLVAALQIDANRRK